MLSETACTDKSGKSRLAGKNLILLFIAFLLLQLNTLAQEGWFWQNPKPAARTLYDVFAIDENRIVMVGRNGKVIRTKDGGQNWETKTVGKCAILNSVYFIDASTGWICGDGLILKTTDGGKNWFYQYDGYMWLRSIYFTDSNTGWAVGSEIMKTTDGGENWAIVSIPPGISLEDIFFIDNH